MTALFFLDTHSTDVGTVTIPAANRQVGKILFFPPIKNKQNRKIRTGYRGRKRKPPGGRNEREPIRPETIWAMEEAGLDVCLRIGVSVMPGNEC